MINWKLRLKNKTTLLSLCVTVIAFVYQILGLFNVVPPLNEETVTQLVTMIINVLAMLGIVVDPTTAGVGDSERALNYDYPRDFLDEVYTDDRRSYEDLVETELVNYEDK